MSHCLCKLNVLVDGQEDRRALTVVLALSRLHFSRYGIKLATGLKHITLISLSKSVSSQTGLTTVTAGCSCSSSSSSCGGGVGALGGVSETCQTCDAGDAL